eukprot:614471-Ditylum_brightwellii.AAC.1
MAIFDFNTGHNSIVPEISQCSNNRSSLKFTMEFFDTAASPILGARLLKDILLCRNRPVQLQEGNVVKGFPSGIVGVPRSSLATPLSILGVSMI